MGGGASANAILAGLTGHESHTLTVAAQDIALKPGDLICEAGEHSHYVYFPTAGVLSLVGMTEGGATVELALVGSEGVVSVSTLLSGHAAPYRAVAQIAGRALRIPISVVSREISECGNLHHQVLRYTQHLIAQVAQSAVCNRFHTAKQRLARWLLMTADRAGTTELPLTHEAIAQMVGGPRSAVTEAAAELREAGAIDYRRARIIIIERDGLRSQACECYDILLGDQRALAGVSGLS
jgi:CRP-like cAMP-binding protein